MATQTFCRIGFAKFGGYEADYLWKGEFRRVYFNSHQELARRMAINGADDRTIEAACDVLDQFEWEHGSYPLFRPAEAVTDFGDAEYLDFSEPKWRYFAATLRVGLLVAPWVALGIFIRWLGVWA